MSRHISMYYLCSVGVTWDHAVKHWDIQKGKDKVKNVNEPENI